MKYLEEIKRIAKDAGDIIIRIYEHGCEVEHKNEDLHDHVTIADKKSEEFIVNEIEKIFPNDSILGEEGSSKQGSTNKTWVIDPLDGTRDFIYRTGHFAVVIGLLEDGIPVFGVAYTPALNTFYYASKGEGSYVEDTFGIRKLEVDNQAELKDSLQVSRVLTTRQKRYLDPIIEDLPFKMSIGAGCAPIKAGHICEQKGHFHINTSSVVAKWDTLVAQVMLEEAGGIVTNLLGEPLDYLQKEDKWGKKSFIFSTKKLHSEIIEHLKPHVEKSIEEN